MRLTAVGRDYHLAALLVTAVGLATGETLFAALGLGMAFASLISLALLRGRAPKAVVVEVVEPRVRVIKGEEGSLTLRIPGLMDTWAGTEVGSVSFDGAVAASVVSKGPDSVTVRVQPMKAGRFTKAAVRLELSDAAGLFSVGRSVRLAQVVLDSLPMSLLIPVRRAFVPPLVVGESPAGSAGRGQEFYGIETYTERSESKDILWKRAAKEPDRPLLARVREANNPESVTIDLVHGEIGDDERQDLIDLQCEALGALGRGLLLAGIRPEIVGPDGAPRLVESDDYLADSIMEVSASGRLAEKEPFDVRGPTILLAVGRFDGQENVVERRRPTVLIGGVHSLVQDKYVLSYTGAEDLTGIVNMVLAA